ncbi:hypothetical protein M9458_014880, partial [Cirrhinus mrigala]
IQHQERGGKFSISRRLWLLSAFIYPSGGQAIDRGALERREVADKRDCPWERS